MKWHNFKRPPEVKSSKWQPKLKKNSLLLHTIAMRDIFVLIIWFWMSGNPVTVNMDLYIRVASITKIQDGRQKLLEWFTTPHNHIQDCLNTCNLDLGICNELLLCEMFHQCRQYTFTLHYRGKIPEGRHNSMKIKWLTIWIWGSGMQYSHAMCLNRE